MVEKISLFVAITLIILFRLPFIRKDLLFLVFALTLAFATEPVFTILQIDSHMTGAFGHVANFYLMSFFSIFLFLSKKVTFWSDKSVKTILLFCIICFLNYINPNNQQRIAIIPVICNVGQLVLFLFLIKSSYSRSTIYAALFEAFACWTILQFILTLCYPILGIDAVTTFFHKESALFWSLKREGYVSAVGTFPHPSQLAFVCAGFSLFYFASYLLSYRKKDSLTLFVINLFVIFFTYSRMTFVALLISLFTTFFLYKDIRFSAKKIGYIITLFVVVYLFTCIPFINNLFLKSDSTEMTEARLLHWSIGLEIWDNNRWIGTGINNHVSYMINQSSKIFSLVVNNEFITSNPIHNIHIIILVETGIIGFCAWLIVNYRLLKQSFSHLKVSSGIKKASMLVCISFVLFNFIYGFSGWSVFNIAVYAPFAGTLYLLYYSSNKRKSIPT